jgi:hypothetical protein
MIQERHSSQVHHKNLGHGHPNNAAEDGFNERSEDGGSMFPQDAVFNQNTTWCNNSQDHNVNTITTAWDKHTEILYHPVRHSFSLTHIHIAHVKSSFLIQT